DEARRFDQRCERARVASPQPDFVSLLGEVGGGGIASIAAAQDGDAHQWRPRRCRRAACTTGTVRRMVLDELIWYHISFFTLRPATTRRTAPTRRRLRRRSARSARRRSRPRRARAGCPRRTSGETEARCAPPRR